MTRALGKFGEAWATGFLTRAGYKIVKRNVRYRSGEIDIIAEDADDLVFVEVKCRRSSAFGAPEASVTRSRYRRLERAVEEYLSRTGVEPHSYRVDVIALTVDRAGRVMHCDHLKGVEAPPV